jgi:hypothetical protein
VRVHQLQQQDAPLVRHAGRNPERFAERQRDLAEHDAPHVERHAPRSTR